MLTICEWKEEEEEKRSLKESQSHTFAYECNCCNKVSDSVVNIFTLFMEFAMNRFEVLITYLRKVNTPPPNIIYTLLFLLWSTHIFTEHKKMNS